MFKAVYKVYCNYIKLLIQKYIWLFVLLLLLILGLISSYILIEKSTKTFDHQLYLQANYCLSNAQTAGAGLEQHAAYLVVAWQKQFPNNYIRLYADKNYLAGYYNIFNTEIQAFEFNTEDNARFFYTEINSKGYRGVRLQTNRLEPKHQLGNLIRVEMVEDFHERAVNSRYILLSVWIPLIIIYLIYIITIRNMQNSQNQQINLAVDYLKKYNSDINKAKNITIPHIPKLNPIIEIVQEITENFEKTTKRQKHFIADASHQLRTPLTIIKLQVEQLSKNHNIDILSKSVNRMIKLTNQLLSLAKFESKNLKIEKVLWHNLVFNISSTWLDIAFKYNIDFGFENQLGNDTYNSYVAVDKLMLEEAINNLIENAVKYRKTSENSKLEPTYSSIITIIAGATSGTAWAKIIDNGLGIPDKYRNNLFNRFFRADNLNTQGSGLGLAIVQEIMNANGGFVRLLNEDDTTFLLVLPRLKL